MSTTYTEHYNFGKQENYADLFSMKVITDNWDSLDLILYGFSNGKQDKLSAENKLSVAFVDFTDAQLAAINSGITDDDVEQIDLNKNNISSAANVGVKNLCKPNVSADSEVTVVVNADLSITVTCNTTALREVHIFTDLSGLTDGKDYILSGCNGGNYSNTYGFAVRTSGGAGKAFESDGETTFTKTAEIVKMDLIIRSGQNWTKTFYPMIRPAYISDPTYQPYALSNAELTAKEQANESDILSDNIISTSFTWGNGYISTGGHIFASTQSYFSQPFTLHAGEKIVVRTKNKNICIIGTTTADSVAVGDNISVLRSTSGVDQEETYDYTATEDIKIVICVVATNYVAYVSNHNTDLLLGSYATAAIKRLETRVAALENQ